MKNSFGVYDQGTTIVVNSERKKDYNNKTGIILTVTKNGWHTVLVEGSKIKLRTNEIKENSRGVRRRSLRKKPTCYKKRTRINVTNRNYDVTNRSRDVTNRSRDVTNRSRDVTNRSRDVTNHERSQRKQLPFLLDLHTNRQIKSNKYRSKRRSKRRSIKKSKRPLLPPRPKFQKYELEEPRQEHLFDKETKKYKKKPKTKRKSKKQRPRPKLERSKEAIKFPLGWTEQHHKKTKKTKKTNGKSNSKFPLGWIEQHHKKTKKPKKTNSDPNNRDPNNRNYDDIFGGVFSSFTKSKSTKDRERLNQLEKERIKESKQKYYEYKLKNDLEVEQQESKRGRPLLNVNSEEFYPKSIVYSFETVSHIAGNKHIKSMYIGDSRFYGHTYDDVIIDADFFKILNFGLEEPKGLSIVFFWTDGLDQNRLKFSFDDKKEFEDFYSNMYYEVYPDGLDEVYEDHVV